MKQKQQWNQHKRPKNHRCWLLLTMMWKKRKYVDAHPDENTSEFQAWANSKADWYDPTVEKTDEILGKRDHEQSEDEKMLKKRSHYGWW